MKDLDLHKVRTCCPQILPRFRYISGQPGFLYSPRVDADIKMFDFPRKEFVSMLGYFQGEVLRRDAHLEVP